MTKKYTAKISPKNKLFADKVRKLVKKYNIIGVVDVESLPAPQFQKIRATVKKTAEILIVKKNIINLVFSEIESSHNGISKLSDKMTGVVGLIFTNDNPFTMYKFIKRNKSSAPAKPGSIAPKDIVIPAGPTPFAPGPIIGELGSFKIKAGISNGKVEIKQDSLVAKEGDEISAGLAGILTRLGIEPMEVGLNIKAIYENGVIYERKVLDVDEEAILNDLREESRRAFSLSLGLGYITKENISYLIGNAGRNSISLGIGIDYPSSDTINQLLQKAKIQSNNLGAKLPEDLRPAGVELSTTVSTNVDNEEPKNEKKEEKEVPKVDAAAGLGSLFW